MSVAAPTRGASSIGRNRVTVPMSTASTAFLSIGLALILIDSVFFPQVAGFATSGFSVRSIIGYYLFPSEIWFMVLGNALVALYLMAHGLKVNRRITLRVAPVLVILVVYCAWFEYGVAAGNAKAIDEFREMAFNAAGLPSILLFARFANIKRVFEIFVVAMLVMFVLLSLTALDNTALTIATFTVSYFVFRLLYRRKHAVPWLLLSLFPFVFKFSKPMLALVLFTVAVSFALAAHLNPMSRNWILSKFKLRIAGVALLILIVLVLLALLINYLYSGAIELAIRYYFLKERVSALGEIRFGDLSGGRLAIWQAAIQSWLQRPIIGYGLGAPVEAYASGWTIKTQFHNYLVQGLHNCGLVGFGVIFGGWFVWLRKSLRIIYSITEMEHKIVLAALFAYVLGVFFYGLYGHPLSLPPNAQLFWLAIGVLSVTRDPYETSPHIKRFGQGR